MKVSCEIKKFEQNNREKLPEGLYLRIDKNGSLFDVSLSEFRTFYEESKRGSEPLMPDPGFGTGDPVVTIAEKSSTADFDKVISYLKGKIAISEADFKEDNELTIESSFGDFLELPWEKMAQDKILVFRKVIGEKKNSHNESLNNFLFILSNANISTAGESANLKDKLKDEVSKIIDSAIEVIPKEFKVDNIQISKHTTRASFPLLPWDKYNYIHVIMHGDEGGGLCLENQDVDRYKLQDVMGIDDTVSVLTDKNFLLFFLSICYSGGGLNNGKNSLAFHITNKGISKYVIGYRFGAGEDSALAFATIFYKTLLSGSIDGTQDSIEGVYKKSLQEYYRMPLSSSGYLPLLYINS